jgi:hypothetical protein
VGKLEEKRLLERSRSRWESNIKIYVKDIGRVGVRWIDLAQDRDKLRADVNTAMNLRIYKMQRNTRLAANTLVCQKWS